MIRLALVLAITGCVQASVQVCDDGTLCPRGYQCDALDDGSGTRCIRPEQLEACNGITDGNDCTLDGLNGTCAFGACELWRCGDGVRQGFEQCDGSDLGTDADRGVANDCVSLGYYETPGLGCDPVTCTFVTDACGGGTCGDDQVNGPESCDGDVSQTCVAIGFDAGAVTCDGLCSFTIVNCSRFGWNPESLGDLIATSVTGTAHDDQWVVGAAGKAAHFDGVFWIPSATGTTQTLRNAWSISRTDVWAVGFAGTVIHYDGAWHAVDGVPAGDYIDVWAASATEVYIATADSKVHRFDGASWTTLPALTGTPRMLRGTSGSDLWVATTQGPLQHWNGTAWSVQSPPNTRVEFVDPNSASDVWVIGPAADNLGNGVIAHFNGTAWTTFVTAGQTYNNIASSAPNDAWVADSGGQMHHFDGVAFSKTTNISIGGLAAVSGLLSLGPQEVVAVSSLQLAYRFRGQTFGAFRTIGNDPFTAPTNLAFLSLAANDVWMTTLDQHVHHFDGTAWIDTATLPVPSRAIVKHGSDVWFGLDNGNVVRDSAFATPEVAATTGITAMVSVGADLWAFSAGVAHRRISANNWEHFTLATNKRVLSASGTAPDDIWAVLDDAGPRLFHFDGDAWSEVTTGSPTRLLAVVAIARDDVHVAAKDGHMLHWNGTAFARQQVASIGEITGGLTSIAASASDDVIAASTLDAFHFDGKQWAPLRLPDELQIAGSPTVKGLRVAPGRVDLMLERFKILTLIRTRPLFCRASELLGPNGCSDGVDTDCDGALDGADDECP